MSNITDIADEIESGNLRVTSRENRSIGHPHDQERMVHSAKAAAAAYPNVASRELECELVRRGWERRDAVRITGWFVGGR